MGKTLIFFPSSEGDSSQVLCDALKTPVLFLLYNLAVVHLFPAVGLQAATAAGLSPEIQGCNCGYP